MFPLIGSMLKPLSHENEVEMIQGGLISAPQIQYPLPDGVIDAENEEIFYPGLTRNLSTDAIRTSLLDAQAEQEMGQRERLALHLSVFQPVPIQPTFRNLCKVPMFLFGMLA